MTSEIQDQVLKLILIGCKNLKDTEWISRQDPFVCFEYGSVKCRSKTCTDGGKNPTFHETFEFSLIEGLREISVAVWNSNILASDYFIGDGKIQLKKVLSQGYDDSNWPLQDKRGRPAGEINLIMHYQKEEKQAQSPPAPMYPRSPYLYPSPSFDRYYPPPPPTGYPSYPSQDSAGYPPPSYYQQSPPAYPPFYRTSSFPYPPSGSRNYPPDGYPSNLYPPPY